jgi:hypothetical protein
MATLSKNASYQLRCTKCRKLLVWSSVDETQITKRQLVCYESGCGQVHDMDVMLKKKKLVIVRPEEHREYES